MRRIFLILTIFLGFSACDSAPSGPEITVYKSPTCGCCKKWITHLEDNGFDVTAKNVADVNPYKAENGLPPVLASCHTALVDGYVIEGHVPADDIKRLLKEKPAISGLAVPGMPTGSPGMEQGAHKDRYDVVAFDNKNQMSVYSSH
ncbi:MAG: DUF411 domain-containing protein [Gammaproteobacteria bacterium]|nr:DUF411 domain-containing protein [Gammaproteobacteria bacterium]